MANSISQSVVSTLAKNPNKKEELEIGIQKKIG